MMDYTQKHQQQQQQQTIYIELNYNSRCWYIYFTLHCCIVIYTVEPLTNEMSLLKLTDFQINQNQYV